MFIFFISILSKWFIWVLLILLYIELFIYMGFVLWNVRLNKLVKLKKLNDKFLS